MIRSELPQALPIPETGEFAARRFRNRENWWLGQDSNSRPVLLVAEPVDRASPDIETADLLVLRNRLCVISGPDGTKGRFTLLMCQTDRPNLRRYFLDICGDLERWSREDPAISLGDLVLQMVHLFRQLQAPQRKSQEGLWGELLVIAAADRPRDLLPLWHSDLTDTFDFGAGSQRIEVKTCATEIRAHHFRLRQLRAPTLQICVVSLQVEGSPGGTSIRQLADEIAESEGVEAAAVLRLRRTIAETLGSDWERAQTAAFDRTRAQHTAMLIRGEDVPTIPCEIPPTLSQVAFVADVTGAATLRASELRAMGGIWASIAPLAP